jgi:uncharacterized protein (DUF1501 family)
VIQLSGGNDALNTVVPYNNAIYYDLRPQVNIPQDKVLRINDELGFNPSMVPIKRLWDQGNVSVINGVGYPSPNRSHFRSMDVSHTAEPDTISNEGWLGRAIRQIDPDGENVIGGAVNGGTYGEYPSLRSRDQTEGDMRFDDDFYMTYSTIADRWLGLDAVNIADGTFNQFDFVD